jgi:hypothetical protein
MPERNYIQNPGIALGTDLTENIGFIGHVILTQA